MCVCCGQRGLTQTPLAVTCCWCPRACWPGQVPAGVTVLPGGGGARQAGGQASPWELAHQPATEPTTRASGREVLRPGVVPSTWLGEDAGRCSVLLGGGLGRGSREDRLGAAALLSVDEGGAEGSLRPERQQPGPPHPCWARGLPCLSGEGAHGSGVSVPRACAAKTGDKYSNWGELSTEVDTPKGLSPLQTRVRARLCG